MNSINLSAVINQREPDLDKASGIHHESGQKPYDTATITLTGTRPRARATDDAENHVFLLSIFRRAEPDDPIHTDGCMEHPEATDFIDCPESIIQETAWNPFKEIRTVINRHAPRFA